MIHMNRSSDAGCGGWLLSLLLWDWVGGPLCDLYKLYEHLSLSLNLSLSLCLYLCV